MNYPPSIIDPDFSKCHLCGSRINLEVHHVMNGPNRKKSTQYGLVVTLCRNCHTGPNGVHSNREKADALKAEAQACFEMKYPGKSFLRIFGRNYL